MEEDLRQELKKLTGERNRVVWEIAKTGDLSRLSLEDKKLAKIRLEHEEFHNQFDIANLSESLQYRSDAIRYGTI